MMVMEEIKVGILHSQALSGSFAEGDKKPAQILAILGSVDPSFRIEIFWMREYLWVHVNKVRGLANRSLKKINFVIHSIHLTGRGLSSLITYTGRED